MPEKRTMNALEVLRNTGFFRDMSRKSLALLAEICVPKAIAKNNLLFSEGERGRALFAVVSGRIRLFRTASDGKQVVIKVVQPGEIFAEVILFEADHYPVSAEAIEESLVYVLGKDRLHGLLSDSGFRDDFIGMLMRKQRYLVQRIQMLTTSAVAERLFAFLKEHFGENESFHVALSKKDIAGAIGATPETLSRLLLRLKEKGTLVWEGHDVRLQAGFWEQWREGEGN